ncbi:hypothetical protein LJR098_003522 [Rhizobium sp. LjRoot98]|uniref:hypothetical protein n=1 Tax=Rhizobium sp. LjRoot98 TaxID=3342345 RepID=UPI003ECDD965
MDDGVQRQSHLKQRIEADQSLDLAGHGSQRQVGNASASVFASRTVLQTGIPAFSQATSSLPESSP